MQQLTCNDGQARQARQAECRRLTRLTWGSVSQNPAPAWRIPSQLSWCRGCFLAGPVLNPNSIGFSAASWSRLPGTCT